MTRLALELFNDPQTRLKLSDEVLDELLDDLLLAVRIRANVCVDELEDVHRGAPHLCLRISRYRRSHQLRRHVQNGEIAF